MQPQARYINVLKNKLTVVIKKRGANRPDKLHQILRRVTCPVSGPPNAHCSLYRIKDEMNTKVYGHG